MIRFCCFCIFFIVPLLGFSYEDTPSCFRELEQSFFDSQSVGRALQNSGIDQGQWSPIMLDLKQASKGIPERLRRMGNSMQPDPFQHPFNAKVAGKLLDEVLYQTFVEVMTPYANADPRFVINLRGMYADIRAAHAAEWNRCVPKDNVQKNIQ